MSHMSEILEWVLYIFLKTTPLALKLHEELGPTFLFVKVMNDYMFTLWKLLIPEIPFESLPIRLDGMKCKYRIVSFIVATYPKLYKQFR